MITYYTHLMSPIGALLLVSDGKSLTGLSMDGQKHAPAIGADWIDKATVEPFAKAKRQLADYFEGKLTEFNLPLALHGTDFQRLVWQQLCKIPYGTTISYGELGQRIGNPGSARAVGLANGRNPISIIVPCHRVIGANGKLTGYGGGLSRKETLLAFEASVANSHKADNLLTLSSTS